MKKADIILYSNLIYPGKGKKCIDGGVAVKGNTIIAIGDSEKINEYVGPKTKIHKYTDQLIMPGFIDSHVHLPCGMQEYIVQIDCQETKSKEDCISLVREYYEKNPNAKVIRGSGWLLNNWETKEMPRKEDLDEVTTEIPICLATADGWTCWVNSKALEKFGYTKENIQGEWENYVFKDDAGELTGIIYSEGCEPTYYLAYDMPSEDSINLAKTMFREMTEYGITTVVDVAAETNPKKEPVGYSLFKEMETNGDLPVRTYFFPAIGRTGDYSLQRQLRETYKDGKVKIAGLKMYVDGVIDTHTAFMLEDYADEPGNRSHGIYEQEEANRLVCQANKEGFSVRFHALGDAAVRRALDAIEYSQKTNNDKSLTNCVEHMEFCHESDKMRFVEQGTVASIQPTHQLLYEDSTEVTFGEERWKNSFPLKSLVDIGAKVAISSDYPVVEPNPFFGVYAAMTRTNMEGRLIGKNPNECIDVYDALQGYTYGGSLTINEMDPIGLLKEGYLADIIVVDGPVIHEEPAEILKRKISLTMLDGEIIFERI